jgi:hypothetical protein
VESGVGFGRIDAVAALEFIESDRIGQEAQEGNYVVHGVLDRQDGVFPPMRNEDRRFANARRGAQESWSEGNEVRKQIAIA